MRSSVPSLLLSLLLGSIGCGEPEDLTVTEVDDIVRQIISDNPLYHGLVCADFASKSFGFPHSELSQEDRAFLQRQYHVLQAWTVPKTGIVWKSRERGILPAEVSDSCKDRRMMHIAVDYISPDRSSAILNMAICCSSLGGQGTITLFRKENDRWTKMKDYGTWMN